MKNHPLNVMFIELQSNLYERIVVRPTTRTGISRDFFVVAENIPRRRPSLARPEFDRIKNGHRKTDGKHPGP